MTDCSFISQFFAYLKNTSSQQQKKKKNHCEGEGGIAAY